MARKRRMSSILADLGGRECFATEAGWQEYQDMLAKLKMRSLSRAMDGDEIHPSHGFTQHRPNGRKKLIVAPEGR
jgi:hypothetical protein